MQQDHCMDHSGCIERISSLETRMEIEQKKTDGLSSKLNKILGGIIVMPIVITLLVTLVQLWIRTGGLFD